MNEDVRTLQGMLWALSACVEGIPPVIPDGVFGTKTKESVAAFQAAAGLPVTGMADAATWRAVTEAYEACRVGLSQPAAIEIRWDDGAVLLPGSRNLHLFLLQAMVLVLRRFDAELPAVAVNGVLDARTERAVRLLQRRFGMVETGAVDRAFWQKLTGLYRLVSGNGEVF